MSRSFGSGEGNTLLPSSSRTALALAVAAEPAAVAVAPAVA